MSLMAGPLMLLALLAQPSDLDYDIELKHLDGFRTPELVRIPKTDHPTPAEFVVRAAEGHEFIVINAFFTYNPCTGCRIPGWYDAVLVLEDGTKVPNFPLSKHSGISVSERMFYVPGARALGLGASYAIAEDRKYYLNWYLFQAPLGAIPVSIQTDVYEFPVGPILVPEEEYGPPGILPTCHISNIEWIDERANPGRVDSIEITRNPYGQLIKVLVLMSLDFDRRDSSWRSAKIDLARFGLDLGNGEFATPVAFEHDQRRDVTNYMFKRPKDEKYNPAQITMYFIPSTSNPERYLLTFMGYPVEEFAIPSAEAPSGTIPFIPLLFISVLIGAAVLFIRRAQNQQA